MCNNVANKLVADGRELDAFQRLELAEALALNNATGLTISYNNLASFYRNRRIN